MSKVDNKQVKHVAHIIGEWGKWQFHMCCLGFVMNAIGAINTLGYAFHAFHVDFWCSDVPQHYPNKSPEMKCNQFLRPNQSCDEWRYDSTQFKRSIISEFNLVCNREDYAALTQIFYILSYLISGLVLSQMQDKYGRRPLVWVALIAEIIGTIGCALSINMTQYIIARFFVGLGGSGRAAFGVIMLESSGPKHRSEISILILTGWVAGYALLPAYAYLLRDYKLMQLWSLTWMILQLVWFCFMDESPRWQICNGQIDKAEATLRKVLKINGKCDDKLKEDLNLLSKYILKNKSENEFKQKLSSIDLFKAPKLRKYTLIFWLLGTINAFIYYGFSVNMADFGGNFYLTFLLSGAVEIPSKFVVAVLLRYIGRKMTFIIFMVIISIASVGITFADNTIAAIILALIGKFGVTSSWLVQGLQESEVFPTNLRLTGKGTVSVVSRIGALTAPFMRNLAIKTDLAVVMAIYALGSIIAAILDSILPETKGLEIPDTITETENLRSK